MLKNLMAIGVALIVTTVSCAADEARDTEWRDTVREMVWDYLPKGKTAILGVPETDNVPLRMRCVRKGTVEIEFPFDVATLKRLPNGTAQAKLVILMMRDDAMALVDGKIKHIESALDGDYDAFVATVPVTHEVITKLGDPRGGIFWQEITPEPKVQIEYPLEGAAQAIKQLQSACRVSG